MPSDLVERLRARGSLLPDHDGRGLVNVPHTVLDVLGARDEGDLPAVSGLDPSLREGVTQVVVVLADGLGYAQLERLCASGDMPFVASIVERAQRRDHAQLLELTTVFPSTTAAAITTLNTGRTPQEHGNIAYFLWLEEFGHVAQMLRWGRGDQRRGSFFDDPSVDPRSFVQVPSIHRRLRERGGVSYLVEPEIFRNEAMTRMHASEAVYVGYILPSTMGVRVAQLLEDKPWGERPAYVYAYWAGVDTAAHQHGPHGPEHAAEAAALDLALRRAVGGRAPGDTLVMLVADHGHAAVDPDKLIDLERDEELASLLRTPLAGEPRLVFIHTDHAERVKAYLAQRYGDAFFVFDRDEALEAGLFGVGDPTLAQRRIGEVCVLIDGDRGAGIMRIDGQMVLHRGSHGGMTPDEMRIPLLAWRA